MVPEAQLIAFVEFGPVNPKSIAILQLAAPGNTASASAGSSPRGPSARNRSTWDSANATPPSADPIIAPIRSRSSCAGSSAASLTANRALVTASWEKRSRRLARFASRWSCGRKSGISAAIRLLNGAGSKRVISRTAEVRAASPVHKPSAPVPIGVTAPTPVMTTLRPLGDTPDGPVADFPGRPVHGHLRHPPHGITERAERPARRHFHGATARVAVQKPDPPIVRQDFGPTLDV